MVDVPAVVVVDDDDMSVQMQQILKAMGQSDMPESTPILEINVDNNIIKKIADSTDEKYIENMSFVLLDQALLSEGVMPKDPTEFAKRVNELLGS